jgi:uncharacterized membrane protein YhiD involved in acid resistance
MMENLLHAFSVSSKNSLGGGEILIGLILPFLLSAVVVWVYRNKSKNINYSTNFVFTLFLFSPLISIITLIIENNIARAFGLVGALSIVRFRTAIKDPLDIIFIFWTLAIGMACGAGYYLAALLTSLVIGVFILVLNNFDWSIKGSLTRILKVQLNLDEEDGVKTELESYLENKISTYRVIHEYLDSGRKEKIYVYSLKTNKDFSDSTFSKEISRIPGIKQYFISSNETSVFI